MVTIEYVEAEHTEVSGILSHHALVTVVLSLKMYDNFNMRTVSQDTSFCCKEELSPTRTPMNELVAAVVNKSFSCFQYKILNVFELKHFTISRSVY